MSRIKASVQYGDWEGTASADDADGVKMRGFLEKKGLIKPGEYLVAMEIHIVENHGGKIQPPYIEALLFEKADYETTAAAVKATPDPLSMRKARVDLTLNQFIGMFKRFAVTLSQRGLELTGREYNS